MQIVCPIYYAGFEVGSGFSGLKLLPADGLALAHDLVTLPSFLADGDIMTLLKSSDPEAKLADVLQQEVLKVNYLGPPVTTISAGSSETSALSRRC